MAVVEELGRLHEELASLKPKQDRLKLLKAAVLSWATDAKAEQALLFDGLAFAAQVSAQENETAITGMEAVYNALGKQKFLSLCSMTLKNLKANLTEAQVLALTRTERTGSRSVTVLRRAA